MSFNLHFTTYSYILTLSKSIKIHPRIRLSQETLNEFRSYLHKKSPRGIRPGCLFPFPQGTEYIYCHSRYEPHYCKFLKLAIYPTFDVFAGFLPDNLLHTLPPFPHPHPFPVPFSLVNLIGQPPVDVQACARKSVTKYFDHSVTQLRYVRAK